MGVLMPVSALPNGRFEPFGRKFVDWLVKNNYKYWQVLPLNPRDGLGSPYNSEDARGIDRGYGTEEEWFKLKRYANRRGIKIIGDLPFFVPKNSRDFRDNQELFRPELLSGAPPDNLNKKGQFWGHPQYDWEKMEEDGFKFFLDRWRWALRIYDWVRLDHFRGYVAVWAIPARFKSGRKGRWMPVPGEKLFKKAIKEFGENVPVITEDLGAIILEVGELRRKFGFLGTEVMVFGARKVKKDVVLYSSTHDTPAIKAVGEFRDVREVREAGEKSGARIFIMPVWDILGLGGKWQFNRPGTKKGNWGWQMRDMRDLGDMVT